MRSIINRQTHHLARLVDDLLDVSRITRGKVELRRARVDLGSMLRQVLALMRPVAESRELHAGELHRRPPHVDGGGRHPPGAGLHQPAGQRRQVHGRRRHRARGGLPGGRGWRGPRGGAGDGHRHRHPRPQAVHHLRAVRPGGRVPGALARGPRHRADAGAQPGGDARRRRLRHQRRPGPGQRVRGEAAPERVHAGAGPGERSLQGRAPATAASSWWRTTRTRARRSRTCWSCGATRCRWRTMAWAAWRRPWRTSPSWPWWTSACPGWTATAWRRSYGPAWARASGWWPSPATAGPRTGSRRCRRASITTWSKPVKPDELDRLLTEL